MSLVQDAPPARQKFADPDRTADGAPRARVSLTALETLWFNTGTLCNIACRNCYIESSPRNDRLVYLTRAEVAAFLDEIERDRLPTRVIGFTGGEPFMNPDMMAILEDTLARGFEVLVLTNAMRPMMRHAQSLRDLNTRHGAGLTMRVSMDHYTRREHEAERGPGSFAPMVEGLKWLSANGFRLAVAGRLFTGESEAALRAGFAGFFAREGISLDAGDADALVLFPEMDAAADVPEITTACWDILGKSPREVMCSSARMVVKRRGAAAPAVLACTLLPYDPAFELGATLKEASGSVALNHRHCATFCVLGGASCGGA